MKLSEWFWSSGETLGATLLITLASYVTLIVMLRISGKRTLSKMNMFDWVVTVAMGSIIASTAVSKSTTFAQGVTACAGLIIAQFVVTWLSVRSKPFEHLVKASPTLLYYRGRFMREEMKRQRIPMSEMLSAIRQSGQGAPDQIEAVVLESSGELIVMNEVEQDQTATLERCDNWTRVRA